MPDNKENFHAISNIERAAKTYKERNKVYGDNYKQFGAIMHALLPDGFTANTEEQWNRLGILNQIMSKLSRYVADPYNGQLDTIHDAGVYCLMLEELDAAHLGLDTANPLRLKACQHIYEKGVCSECGALPEYTKP